MKRLLCLLLFPASLFAAAFSGWIGTCTTDETIITGSEGIYSFQWNPETGTLGSIKLAAVTTNPSFLAMHPNGRYMYAVNEDVAPSGMDRISAFAIDNPAASGSLQRLGSASSQGSAPCHVSIDATGRYLITAHQVTGDLFVFGIDPATGSQQALGSRVAVPSPVVFLLGAAINQ